MIFLFYFPKIHPSASGPTRSSSRVLSFGFQLAFGTYCLLPPPLVTSRLSAGQPWLMSLSGGAHGSATVVQATSALTLSSQKGT